MYDVIIIGSGPSGLTAAIYTSRAQLKTLVIAGSKWGGQLQLTSEVENFPGFPEGIKGPDLMMNMRKQAERFGTEFVDKDVKKVDFSKKPYSVFVDNQRKSSAFKSRAVILATGADTIWLGVKGEKELIGKGVSSCASCDAFFYKGKTVAVVGGGDSAMEEALTLTKFAQKVILIHRRDSFRASKIMQERVLNHPKIEVFWNTEVEEIKGEGTVNCVNLITNYKLRITNEKVMKLIKKNKGTTLKQTGNQTYWKLIVDGVFVAIGHKPNSDIFKGKIDTDEKGFIKRLETRDKRPAFAKTSAGEAKLKFPTMTNIDGVFVAGDVYDYRYKQAITAAGYGCEAALDVERWLEEESLKH